MTAPLNPLFFIAPSTIHQTLVTQTVIKLSNVRIVYATASETRLFILTLFLKTT